MSANPRVDVRAAPDEAFIADVRRRFPVEHEIDRVLTAKLRSRGYESVQVGSASSIVRQVNWWRRVWEEDRPEAVA